MSFGKPQTEPPTEWAKIDLQDVGGGIYVHVPVELRNGDTGKDILVYHWHTPTKGAHRWGLASCGLHTVLSVDPLTLDPSLACDDGCPSHGWIRNGEWVPA